MLLPDKLKGAIPERCKIIPTITGSLVIFCPDLDAVLELLDPLGKEKDETEGLSEIARAFCSAINSRNCVRNTNQAWYVKYKTPSFGALWNNSREAINAPRGCLLRTKARVPSHNHPCSVERWLFLHPVDSWVWNYRSIIVTRSAGVVVARAIQELSLSWRDYQLEFLGLAASTLEFQARGNSLVHGDINEGNLLYYCNKHNESDLGSDIDSEHDNLFPVGHRLVLIDWDEASRPKPFRRKAETDEEHLRYPEGLIDFPEQYTQQQLMHLFGTLARKHYHLEVQRVLDGGGGGAAEGGFERNWMVPLLRSPPPREEVTASTSAISAPYAKFIGRSAVEQRFRAMLRGLEAAQLID